MFVHTVRTLLGLFLLASGLSSGQDQPATKPSNRLSFRLVAEAGSPNVEHEVLPAPNDYRQSIAVSKMVLLSDSNVESIDLLRLEGRTRGLVLTLTKEAGERMRELTNRNVGKELAIVFDGKVLSAPNIAGPIGRSVAIDLGATMDEEAVVERVRELYVALGGEAPPTTQP
jgi:preprotein translocase subunit SecD